MYARPHLGQHAPEKLGQLVQREPSQSTLCIQRQAHKHTPLGGSRSAFLTHTHTDTRIGLPLKPAGAAVHMKLPRQIWPNAIGGRQTKNPKNHDLGRTSACCGEGMNEYAHDGWVGEVVRIPSDLRYHVKASQA